jgi:predicted transposase/invertase (TIGR01784 family)
MRSSEEVAEIARFTPEEVRSYEDSLKTYRDLKNSIDTAREEGEIKGKIEGKIEIAKEMIKNGEPIEKIIRYTGLTKEQLEEIKNVKRSFKN